MSTELRGGINLTEGDIFRPLMLLSAPIVLSQLLQVSYNLIDTFWVGRLGADAVSMISFAWPIVFLMISLASGFTVAGTTLVSQNEGAGRGDRVDFVAAQTIGFTLGASVVLAVLGYVLAPTLMTLIGANPGTNIYAGAVTYTRTIFFGIYFMFGFFMFQALLRGYGDTVTPLYLMLLSVVINILLDPFLIFGFTDNALFALLGLSGLETTLFELTGFTGFGVQGAAIASVVSRGIGALIGVWLLFSGRVGIQLSIDDFRPDFDTISQIVRIGAPSSAEQSMRAIGVTALTAIIAIAGPNAVAALGIGNRLNSLVFLPAIGLAQGTSTAVGQNVGAAKIDRAKRSVTLSAEVIAVALVFISVLAYVFAEPAISIFVTGAGADTVIAIGTDYLRIIGPTFLFLGVFRVINGAFKGSGNTGTSMVFAFLSLWVFRLPLAYVLLVSFGLGAVGVWYAIAFSNVAGAIVAGAWFLRGTWTESVVEENAERDGSAACEGDCIGDHIN
jgi:putative MATE family efflux protein